MFCSECGKEIKDNSKFCSFCGAKQGISTSNYEDNRRNTTLEDKKIKFLEKKLDDIDRKNRKKEIIEGISGLITVGLLGWGGWALWKALNPEEKTLGNYKVVKTYNQPNDIFNDLKNNRYVFDNQIDGKVVRIKGYLDKDGIKKDRFYIEGSGFISPPRVACYPQSSELRKLANLKSGQTILITGEVKLYEFLGDSIDLKPCIFTTNVKQEGSGEILDILGDTFRDLQGTKKIENNSTIAKSEFDPKKKFQSKVKETPKVFIDDINNYAKTIKDINSCTPENAAFLQDNGFIENEKKVSRYSGEMVYRKTKNKFLYCITEDFSIIRVKHTYLFTPWGKDNNSTNFDAPQNIVYNSPNFYFDYSKPEFLTSLSGIFNQKEIYQSVPCIFTVGESEENNCNFEREPSQNEYLINGNELITYQCKEYGNCDFPQKIILGRKFDSFNQEISNELLNHFAGSIEKRSKNIEKFPLSDNPWQASQAYAGRAYYFIKARDYENAIKDYSFLIENYKGDKKGLEQPTKFGYNQLYKFLQWRSKTYRHLGKFQDAISDGNRMIEITSNLSKDVMKNDGYKGHLEKARAYKALGDLKNASLNYNKTFELISQLRETIPLLYVTEEIVNYRFSVNDLDGACSAWKQRSNSKNPSFQPFFSKLKKDCGF